MTGRPSSYTPEIADKICEHIVMGRSLVKICAEMGIGYSTVMEWLNLHPEFTDKYARAKDEQADFLADELLEIADHGINDTYEDDEGRTHTNHDVIARSRLRVDTRKWIASKLKPKKYGDKTDINLNGKLDTTALTDDQLAAAIKQAAAAAGVTLAVAGEGEAEE